MPDLDTLLDRLARQGVSRPRINALQKQLGEDMRQIEIGNYTISIVGLFVAVIGLGLVGLVALGVVYSLHQGITNFTDFPSDMFWITYLAVVVTSTVAVSIIRPRSTYGLGHGPYTVGQDPLYWQEGPVGEWANLARLALALPNLLRMSLFNLTTAGQWRRLRPNTDLAMFILLAAEKRIVAEEILLIQKKKRPRDLWLVLGALSRMGYVRHERIRHGGLREVLIWRGRAAEEALGLVDED